MDYYSILGVLPTADDIVIKAAYKVLASKYHPDKSTGNSHKMAQVNLAYETLSNPSKKRDYDSQLKKNNSLQSIFAATPPNTNSELLEDWQVAIKFHPDLEQNYSHLAKVNTGLAYAYQLKILESKDYKNLDVIAKKIKQTFLAKYFGESEPIQRYAEYLITNNFHNAALELNKYIRVLGSDVNLKDIITKLNDKFDILPNEIVLSSITNEMLESFPLDIKTYLKYRVTKRFNSNRFINFQAFLSSIEATCELNFLGMKHIIKLKNCEPILFKYVEDAYSYVNNIYDEKYNIVE